jgi:heptosyltransferase-1
LYIAPIIGQPRKVLRISFALMPNRILIIRSSSLGDLVHVLPAISDIARHMPGVEIDWLVEEAFVEIPSWHPAVHTVIPVAHRRWRKAWWSVPVRAERQALRERLGALRYDLVLDMQGLLKSVWLLRQTHGLRHGLDWRSAHEPFAALFYQVRHRVAYWQSAVVRQRCLAARAFGYDYLGPPDFGLQGFTRRHASVVAARRTPANAAGDFFAAGAFAKPQTEGDYAVIMPSASHDNKLWPEQDWRAVLRIRASTGCSLKVMAGNEREAQRARTLVAGLQGAQVVPRMGLTAVAQLLAGARLMVGLDSGLTHLAAALGRPTIGIYRASTPLRTPLVGSNYTANLGDRGATVSRAAVIAAVQRALVEA